MTKKPFKNSEPMESSGDDSMERTLVIDGVPFTRVSFEPSDGPNAETRNLDTDLCRLIAQAHNWFDQLTSGEASTVREIAKREKLNEHEIARVLHLAFLSPRIVDDILDGRQAEGVSVYRLRRLSSIPFDWAEQVELLENLR